MPFSTHSGRSSGRAALIEQGVSPCDHERVEVAFPGEPREHVRLVHPGADRPDGTFGAESGQGRVGTGDSRLPMRIRVVDEQDVNPVESEPLEARLDRAHHTIVAVVEDRADPRRIDVEGILPSVERLPVDVGAGRDRVPRVQETTDLGRQRE